MNRRIVLILLAGSLQRVAPSVRTTSARRSVSRRLFARRTPLPPAQAASIADLKWFEVFKDEKLQELIRTALEQNYDLRDAVARVEAGAGQPGHHPLESVSQFRRRRQRGNQSSFARRRDAAAAGSFCLRRIAISDRPRWSCCRSKSTSGAGCGAPPRPRAPIF